LPEKSKKWNESHELAKGAVKLGRYEGRTPMQLLADYNDNQDLAAGELWKEYAAAFKNKRQLAWSKGFRNELGLGPEKQDKELAEEQTEESAPVAFIYDKAWKAVCANDIRGEVLRAAYYGQISLQSFLRDNGITEVDYPGLYDDYDPG